MSLQKEISGGVRWNGASMAFVTTCHVLMLVILARFLAPSDFGLMAVMMVVIGIAQACMDMGISNAIVQRQSITHEQLSSLYWLNIFCGAVVSVVVFLSAPLVAAFYGHENLTELLRMLSAMFTLGAIGQQFKVLCQKTMQFRRLAGCEMLAAFCALVMAVFGAMQGWGAHALVAAFLTQAVVSSSYFLLVGLSHHHRPALMYHPKSLEGFISFGLYQMGERLAGALYQNADNILIGKFLGVQALGFYTLAWQICIIPMQRLSPVLSRILFPLYARMQGQKDELQTYYTMSLRAISLVACP
ncbi:MAG TPA: MOP flippase family protein, partial [Alphaproteobacteria bacterium]|nr:MOP flippase family protein [Alphaproteobacteria bacterium]